MHEWPLLIFTLFVQGAAGSAFFMTLLICSGRAGKLAPSRLLLTLFAICLCGGVGLLASVFHLGYPLNAFNALRHFSSSWLSREIIFASLFLTLAGLAFLAALLKWPLWKGLIPLATIAGFVDVYCMGEIYRHTSVVTWTHVNTQLMFFGTVGIAGAVLTRWLLSANVLKNSAIPGIAAAVVIMAVVARFLVQPSYLAWLAEAGMSDALTFPHQPLEAFRALSGVNLFASGLSAVGALFFAAGSFRQRHGMALAGGVMLLVAEVVLRYVFFTIR